MAKSLKTLVHEWLDIQRKELSWDAYCTYERIMLALLARYPKVKHPERIDRLEADQWRASYRGKTNWREIPKVFWYWLMDQGIVPTNPFSTLEKKEDFF